MRSILIMIGGAGALAIAGIAAVALSSPEAPDPAVQAYLARDLGDGRKLPPIVARVGSVEVTSNQYATAVAFTRINNRERNLGMSEPQIQRSAMNGLVRAAALKDRARTEGIVVTDAEVRSFIRAAAVERPTALAQDAKARAAFEAILASRHLASAAAYDNDPVTLAAVRDALTAEALVNKHVGEMAAPDTREAWIQGMIASEEVHIYVQLA